MTEHSKSFIIAKFSSPATAYQIILTELDKKHNSKDEKILKVFEILDELLPNLGVYHEIMKMVRQQLFDAVFSNEFTGANTDQKSSSVQRLSFYSLYRQLVNSRDDKREELQEKLNEKEEMLKNKETEINDLKNKINELNKDLNDCGENIKKLDKDLVEKKMLIEGMERKFQRNEQENKNKIENLNKKIHEFKNELEKNAKEIEDLSVYKKAYDEINQTFSLSIDDDYGRFQKKQFLSNRKNQISNDILNAKKLEEQILTLINISTEEYDKFIEKKTEYLSKKILNSKDDSNTSSPLRNSSYTQLDRHERSILFKELEKEKQHYKKSISDLKSEYDMIVQHRTGLEEKLYLLEVDRETNDYIRRQKGKSLTNQNTTTNSAVQGLEEHYEPIRKGPDRDQFGLQDRIFSKWACTMQTSINGKTWFDCKQVKFCENCGEKTLICPHKLSLNEAIIQIPTHTQYLRFSRPKLQYNQFIVKRALDNHKKQLLRISNTDFLLSSTSVLTNYLPEFPVDIMLGSSDEAITLLNEGNSAIGMPHNFQRIWYDFSQRTSYKRQVPRPFAYDRTISLLQQFLAYLHNKEVYTDADPVDIVESLYEYFERRYELEDIKFAAIFDFFSSISYYASKSKFIEIFCHVLIGNLDRGIINYILYLGEVIDMIEWIESEDVKIFFAIIYPYCDDDDLDTLTLDFISFSENKISKKLVWDFIMVLILRKKDFLVNEMEFRLSALLTNEDYSMKEPEFLKAMEHFFFINDEKQIKNSYRTALAHCLWDSEQSSVPINKLAHIISYYCLLQIVNELQDNINNLMNDSRQKIKENELKQGPVPPKKSTLVEYEDEFIKISDIDKLALTSKELNEIL